MTTRTSDGPGGPRKAPGRPAPGETAGAATAARHAPATLRNREPLLAALRGRISPGWSVLEIASGTGEHAAYLAPRLEVARWIPSDADPAALASIAAHAAGIPGIAPPCLLDVHGEAWPVSGVDAVFCANLLHIAPWEATPGLLRGARRALVRRGPLLVYGPFAVGGRHVAPSNLAFDRDLRARDPRWGVRDLDAIAREAAAAGLPLTEVVHLPANNSVLVFRER